MLNFFRIASLLEGLSFLLILAVSFNLVSRDFVYVFGMGHGILFIMYFAFSFIVSHKQGWSVIVWGLVLFASITPFAFIFVELFLKKELIKVQKSI